ncbi:hypothetical protein AVEN_1155-1 [Araneus ventricosus]|uniref:Uncharacterized protein n=1 Tax=Araneus ventricosus TaxID=182803 RepID=A0A4Y2QLV6_ARAVE|nr:hypothetical protein AVEN_1155-1 [Araneus ventricosus]
MGLSKLNYLAVKIFKLQQSIINSVYLFVDDVASLEKHLTAGNHNFTKISSTLDKVRFRYIEKLKASTGRSPIAANEPKNLSNNTTIILNVFRRGWELEQQDVQNLLTTPEPIHDAQLQLVGYEQEKDDKGKKRSLNICPTTPKRIKSIYD